MIDLKTEDLTKIIGQKDASNLMENIKRRMIPEYRTVMLKDRNGQNNRNHIMFFDLDKVITMYEKRTKSLSARPKNIAVWKNHIAMLKRIRESKLMVA